MSLTLKRFAKGLRFAISVITTPLVFFSKFLKEISSSVISLTVIFKVSISFSLLTVLVFLSLNSSEDSNLPKINLFVIDFFISPNF